MGNERLPHSRNGDDDDDDDGGGGKQFPVDRLNVRTKMREYAVQIFDLKTPDL